MISVVLLSGGTGSRMNQAVPKQYLLLAGKPVIMHTIERLDTIDNIGEIVIVCADEYRSAIELMLKQYGIHKHIRFTTAGHNRQASVRSGLSCVETDSVLIHEAARPFVKSEEFEHLIASEEKNAIVGSPINYTVLKGKDFVEGILNRSELINVQLPQKFDTTLLKKAHELAYNEELTFTEDASLLYHYIPEIKIKVFPGTEYNIKITTPVDLIVGDIIYREYFQRRV